MTEIIPLGTTEPLDFALKDGGVAIDGTGLTVTLELFTYTTRAAYTTAPVPTVAWLVQASGTVRVSGAGALPVGTYLVRYRLTDGAGKFGYAPNKEHADRWRVVRVPAG